MDTVHQENLHSAGGALRGKHVTVRCSQLRYLRFWKPQNMTRGNGGNLKVAETGQK